MLDRLRNLGPGALVTAAFIGPGTITTCTLAGTEFGYALLWALIFATLATIALQEMSARLGIITQKGLGTVLRDTLETSSLRWPLFAIILVALFLGNCAYEAGNLSGAALGLQTVFGETDTVFRLSVIAIALIAAILLWIGSYRIIERLLLALVVLMAVSFVITVFLVRPDMGAFLEGMVVPKVPPGSLMIIIALIGTTVIPYNLFLHASAVKDRWNKPEDLSAARSDTTLAIGLGGLITILIAATAASFAMSTGLRIESAGDMAQQFEPLYGRFSTYILGLGFLAAGLSSAVAAPLATAYAVSEVLGFRGGTRSWTFKTVALIVILAGAATALTGIRPIRIILLAQFANGLLLPIIAGFLLFAMNQTKWLGRHANSKAANLVGAAIVLITFGLGVRLILSAVGMV